MDQATTSDGMPFGGRKIKPLLLKSSLLVVISLLLFLNLDPTLSRAHKRHLLTTTWATLGAALLMGANKLLSFVKERRKLHRIFDRGHVPSMGNAKLFSGNIFECMALGSNLEVIDRLHRRLGKTFGMFYGPDAWVMSTDLELLQRVFVTEGTIHVDISQYRLPFVREINESLSQNRGNKWRRTRRIMGPSFAPHQMRSDNVHEDIGQACKLLLNYIEANKTGSSSIFDIHYAFKRFSLEVIFRVAFGRLRCERFEPNSRDELIDLLDQGTKLISGRLAHASIMFDRMQHLFGLFVPFTPLGRIIRYVHKIVDESLSIRRGKLAGGAVSQRERKMIDSLLESFDAGKLDDDSLRANIFFILLSGFETTSSTLTMLLWLLANNQQAQEKLRQAILSEGEQTDYSDWCIYETLRLYPAVPTAIGRIIEHDIEHEGQTFFKGTTINASIWSIHRSSHFWGQDSNLFRPERFGEPTDQPACRFFAFAIGPRHCIGQNLAMAQMRAILSRIIIKYRVSLCSRSPREIDIVSPNMIHFIINHPIKLAFTEVSLL